MSADLEATLHKVERLLPKLAENRPGQAAAVQHLVETLRQVEGTAAARADRSALNLISERAARLLEETREMLTSSP